METMVSMLQEDAVALATASPPQKNKKKIQALLVPTAASLWGLGGCWGGWEQMEQKRVKRRCSNHGRSPALGPGPDGSAGCSPLCPPAFPTDPGAAMGPPCHGASSLTKSTVRGGAGRLCSGVLYPCSEKWGTLQSGVGRRSAPPPPQTFCC